MSGVPQSWSLVIFCYNEQGTIEKVIKDAIHTGEQLAPNNYEVLVVDDGSNDGSSQLIDKLVPLHPYLRCVRHSKNKGIGFALNTGYTEAANENVCAIPADGQFNLKELLPFHNMAQNEVISFYRPIKQGYSAYRNILNWVNLTSNRLLIGLDMKDVNWVKVYKRHHLRSIPIELKSSLVESELCAKLSSRGVVFREYPSEYLLREHGEPKGGSLKTMSAAAFEFSKLIFSVNKYRYSVSKQPANNAFFNKADVKNAR